MRSAGIGCCLRVGRLVLPLVTGAAAWGAPVSAPEVLQMLHAWQARAPIPLGTPLPKTVAPEVRSFADQHGQVLYYVIPLRPEGFVVASADTEVEPIIAWSATARWPVDSLARLRDILELDLGQRARASGRQDRAARPSAAVANWARLLGRSAGLASPGGDATDNVDDLRVAPFVPSRWSQGTIWNGSANVALYNYYTPPYAPGASSNYVAGCNATAWGQILRYLQYPTQGVGTNGFAIRVDASSTLHSLRGGDGLGGPYRWDLMPSLPRADATEAERQAIGALLADLGVANGTSYTATDSVAAPSGALLTNVFHFSQVVADGGPTQRFAAAVNANLDARLPTWLTLWGQNNQHAAVCDGYGYNLGTPYYHLNLGWAGMYDAWYNLPAVGTPYESNSLGAYYYNIYTNGSGEIVSGRVSGTNQAPVPGAVIPLVGGGLDQPAVTDERGIYAFAQLPSSTVFFLTCAKDGYRFWPQRVTTGQSRDNQQVGNLWGVDFGALSGCVVWGTVRRVDGVGCAGALVQFSNGGGAATTDATGYFQNMVPVGWSGTITALVTGFDVVPPARGWTNLTANLGNQDFVVQMVMVSGAVALPDGLAVGSATHQLSKGGQVSTDASGKYEGTVPVGWSGTITPLAPAFGWLPATRTLSHVTNDVVGQDFVCQAAVVSGKVTRQGGGGLEGLVVQFSNGGGQARTGVSGSFTNLVRRFIKILTD